MKIDELQVLIKDFKTKFTRGPWLDEYTNFIVIEKWFHEKLLSRPAEERPEVLSEPEAVKIKGKIKKEINKDEKERPVSIVQ